MCDLTTTTESDTVFPSRYCHVTAEQLKNLYTAKEKEPPLTDEAKREKTEGEEGTDGWIFQRLAVRTLNNMNKHVNSNGT